MGVALTPPLTKTAELAIGLTIINNNTLPYFTLDLFRSKPFSGFIQDESHNNPTRLTKHFVLLHLLLYDLQ